jgi:LPS-assembly lipoprotein
MRVALLLIGVTVLSGCGFHLRGSYNIPAYLKHLQISPAQSMDPFHHMLRRVLASNEVQLIESPASKDAAFSTLHITHQDFQEQALAYGLDGQLNRARLVLKVDYELHCANPKKSIQGQVRVSRELTIDPQNILASDNERQRLKNDLSIEAASQLVFQLSMQSESASKIP